MLADKIQGKFAIRYEEIFFLQQRKIKRTQALLPSGYQQSNKPQHSYYKLCTKEEHALWYSQHEDCRAERSKIRDSSVTPKPCYL